MVPQKEAALSCANVLNRNIALSKKNMKVCQVCLHGCMGAWVRVCMPASFFFFAKTQREILASIRNSSEGQLGASFLYELFPQLSLLL